MYILIYILFFKFNNTLFFCLLFITVNSTQIFVAAENNVKFEVGGVSGVQNTSDPLTSTTNNQQQPTQQKPC